jgi:hypothetical protein
MAVAGMTAGVMALTSGVATAEGGPESSIRYSTFVVPEEGAVIHGWQASVVARPERRLSWVLDGGGHYADGDSVHTLLAGPRLSTRPSRGGVSLFAQVLAGVGLLRDDETAAVFAALPGFGIDVGAGKPAGFRVQVDWPLITNYGVLYQAPRISAGVVLRPGRR